MIHTPPFNPTLKLAFNSRTGDVNSATERGWPLLTVETEVKGDSKKILFMKGILSWLAPWACCAGTIDFGCSKSAEYTKKFFLTVHYFNFLPTAQQAGHWQAAGAGSPVS
jgi:hypothetical protein